MAAYMAEELAESVTTDLLDTAFEDNSANHPASGQAFKVYVTEPLFNIFLSNSNAVPAGSGGAFVWGT